MNKITIIIMTLSVAFIISGIYGIFTNFINGFLLGFGVILFLVGIYIYKSDISKLKELKKNIFNRFF